jgi:hypothetical protein
MSGRGRALDARENLAIVGIAVAGGVIVWRRVGRVVSGDRRFLGWGLDRDMTWHARRRFRDEGCRWLPSSKAAEESSGLQNVEDRMSATAAASGVIPHSVVVLVSRMHIRPWNERVSVLGVC